MKLHPLTYIIVTVELAVIAVTLPTLHGFAFLSIGFIAVLVVPSRTDVRLARPFIKVLVVAAIFLFLMHGLRFKPPGIIQKGILTGIESFVHIAVPFTGILYLSRHITSEEFFALLVSLRVPSVVILILFRTLWLVPRLMERMDEVMTAQKLRGMRIESPVQRARAILPTLSPIFSSMLDEISENSLVLTSRGFLQPGRKSHLLSLRYRWMDAALTAIATFVLLMFCF